MHDKIKNDSKNNDQRTASSVRTCFSKQGAKKKESNTALNIVKITRQQNKESE